MTKNNAIPSWSGFVYQGKITILATLEKMLQIYLAGEDFRQYEVELEEQEDFAFLKNQEILELYQVKARAANNWREYRVALENLRKHRRNCNNPDAKCYLATSEPVLNWEDYSNQFQADINLYKHKGKHVSKQAVIDESKSLLGQFLNFAQINYINRDAIYGELCLFMDQKVMEMHRLGSLCRHYRISFSEFLHVIKNSAKEETVDARYLEMERIYLSRIQGVLIPANEIFLNLFGRFMDPEIALSLRTRSAYTYCDGIIKLFLKDKILNRVDEGQYINLSLQEKAELIKQLYDAEIGNIILDILELDQQAASFDGVEDSDIAEVVLTKAEHIIELLFVHYFREDHPYERGDIFFIFSMLPLKNRIFILEQLELSVTIIDRLSLAYVKNGENEKAIHLLQKGLGSGLIDDWTCYMLLEKLGAVARNVQEVQRMNSNYQEQENKLYGKIDGNQLVYGMPSSQDVFDAKKAFDFFASDVGKEKMRNNPRFMKLFCALMNFDVRKY